MKNSYALVTGATSGIGLEISRDLAKRGYNLILVSRTTEKLDQTSKELIKKFNIKCDYFSSDLTEVNAPDNIYDFTKSNKYNIDILINNAGCHERGYVEENDPQNLGRMIDVNLKAPIVLSRMVLPHMTKSGCAIINVASLAGRVPVPGSAVYSASKFGLRAFTYALANELQTKAIKIATVSPGPIDTPFIMSDIDSVSDLTFSQKISTDRPSNTDNSSTLIKNLLQIESGVLKSNLFKTNPREINYTTPTLQLRYGLTKNIEIRILEEFGFSQFVPDTFGIIEQTLGLNSFQLGTKIQIFKKESSPFEFALLTQFVIPKLTNENTSLINTTKLLGSYKIKNNLNLGFSFGYNNNFSIKNNGLLAYSLLVGNNIGSKTAVFFELYGNDSRNKFFQNCDAGIAYLIKENLQIDFFIGTGINHAMFFSALGFSWYLKQKK